MSLRLAYLKANGYVTEEGDLRHTKVTNFCLPMFGVFKGDFKGKLLNAYIEHGDVPYLYIVTLNDENVTDLLVKLGESDDFIESFDDDDGKEFVFKFKIPSVYLDDYYKILNGVYSEISTSYKNVLRIFYGNTVYSLTDSPLIVNGQVATTMWEVLNPSLEKKKIIAKHFGVDPNSVKELISKPDLRYELYKKANELYNQEEQI